MGTATRLRETDRRNMCQCQIDVSMITYFDMKPIHSEQLSMMMLRTS